MRILCNMPLRVRRVACILIVSAALVQIISAEADQTLSEFQRELLASSVVVYSPKDPNLPCRENEREDPGCGGIGSGVAFGRSMGTGEPAGIALTNRHVTRGREMVLVFVPRLKNLDEYSFENIQEALIRYDLGESWSGGGLANDSCFAADVYLDRSVNPPRNRIGSVFKSRVIAEHNSSDLAIIQSCTLGLKPLVSNEDCRHLNVNDPIYTVGSSRRYGHFTLLLANFIGCNEHEIKYLLLGERGRSGSPLVTEDRAIIGIHASVASDGQYGIGVPIDKAFDILDELRIIRSVRLIKSNHKCS